MAREFKERKPTEKEKNDRDKGNESECVSRQRADYHLEDKGWMTTTEKDAKTRNDASISAHIAEWEAQSSAFWRDAAEAKEGKPTEKGVTGKRNARVIAQGRDAAERRERDGPPRTAQEWITPTDKAAEKGKNAEAGVVVKETCKWEAMGWRPWVDSASWQTGYWWKGHSDAQACMQPRLEKPPKLERALRVEGEGVGSMKEWKAASDNSRSQLKKGNSAQEDEERKPSEKDKEEKSNEAALKQPTARKEWAGKQGDTRSRRRPMGDTATKANQWKGHNETTSARYDQRENQLLAVRGGEKRAGSDNTWKREEEKSKWEKNNSNWEKVDSTWEKADYNWEKADYNWEKAYYNREKDDLKREKDNYNRKKDDSKWEKADSNWEKANYNREKDDLKCEKSDYNREKDDSKWEKADSNWQKDYSKWEKDDSKWGKDYRYPNNGADDDYLWRQVTGLEKPPTYEENGLRKCTKCKCARR